ncbi:polysaccharide deacetylase family protein [Bacillus sp. B190/17]|uniref:Polysaccharide deacetylase family protein n=1 Tax=Bacillus lumedeiriae TaxID=3058829 RepID=A0ABW8IDZ0_9BACI
MTKRWRWRGALALFFLFILIGFNQLVSIDTYAKNEKVETKKLSKYPGLHLETRTSETKIYTMAISSPIAEDRQINEPIQQWVKQQEKQFLTKVKNNKNKLDKKKRANLTIKVDTTKVNDNIYSLVFSSYQYTGEAKGQETIKTFIIDTTGKRFLKVTDVLRDGKADLDNIRTIVTERLNHEEDIAFYIMDDLLEEALSNPSDWKWSLSNKALTFYFDKYEVAAGAAGSMKAAIPLEELEPFLKEAIVKELKITDGHKEQSDARNIKQVPLDPNGKYIALTFDDGPNSTSTPQVLETLKAHNAVATFFMLGSQVEYYPVIAKQVLEAGHEIGSHTENHRDLSTLNESQIRQELGEASRKIEEAVGQKPTLLRPPYGAYNDKVLNAAKQDGTPIILWSVDSLDWKSRNAQAVNDAILRNIAPGAIVLMHDIHLSTAEALPALLTALQKEGYQFVTVSQLLSLDTTFETGPFYKQKKSEQQAEEQLK